MSECPDLRVCVERQLPDSFSTAHLRSDLRARTVRGGFLTLASQGIQFGLQSVSTIVLARLLTPGDFGLVAMVTAITGLGQAFADLGLSEATIQQEHISHGQVSALFWLNVAIGAGLSAVTSLSAPALAWFYHEPRLKGITLLMSLTFLICGLRVQHDALLKRQMRFRLIAVRDITSYVFAVPFAILLAWRGAGYWAIVALPLTLNLIQMVLSWWMAWWLPGLPTRDARVSSMVVFGGHVALSYLMINLCRSADNVLVGWHWGAHPLGLYSKAYNLLMLPVRQLSAPAASVAVPAFSTIQNDSARFGRYYLRAANLMLWLATPMFAFLFVAARPVIVLVLGAQWLSAVPVFRILAISALAQLLFELTVWSLVSRGRSRELSKLLVILTPMIVSSFVIGLPFGIKGVALSGSLAWSAIIPVMLKYAFRGTDLTLRRVGRAILWPLVLGLAGVLMGQLSLAVVRADHMVLQLLAVLVGFVTAYIVGALVPIIRGEFRSVGGLVYEFGFFRRGE